MAVFRDFSWDSSVLDPNGQALCFTQVNVFYGRNYSGKTTLSRIIRAFETGLLSDKYNEPAFQIQLEDGSILTEKDYSRRPILVRVFNEDFVQENLRFTVDPDSPITSFAVLGEDNARIEAEIKDLQNELGVSNEDQSTGLYLKLCSARAAKQEAENNRHEAIEHLEKQKNAKATDRKTGIKYQFLRFGKQNYSIRDLSADINTVTADDYCFPSENEIQVYEMALTEQKLASADELNCPSLALPQLISKCKELCERKIGASEKIQELLRNAALEEWVRQGLVYHKDRSTCAFCGHPLTDSRWDQLHRHFDRETETLISDIRCFLDTVKSEKERVKSAFNPDISRFYSAFYTKLNTLQNDYDTFAASYCDELDKLVKLVETRLKSIHVELPFSYTANNVSCSVIFQQYNELRKLSNQHGNKIAEAKVQAQDALRLLEVKKFVSEIDYAGQIKKIEELEKSATAAKEKYDQIGQKVSDLQKSIDAKKRLLNDEEKGAQKVNVLLGEYFGCHYLSLKAVSGSAQAKGVYFEVIRDGEKAYQLSEGERSLIAFCYFIAKLDDVETAGKKPIIWIDDPISSLDSNHVYFVYSLIEQGILGKEYYDQLFITTHNLQFLKYLRHLSINNHSNRKGNNRLNLLIERQGNNSTIRTMPNYLKEHGTEFNRWFACIYQCAHQESVTDDNAYLFESFGNNARKFLETYLFYKYPDKESFEVHLSRFFGEHKIPPILVRKVADELSHAQGDLENYGIPLDEPETHMAAKLILERLNALDSEQYAALVSTVKC